MFKHEKLKFIESFRPYFITINILKIYHKYEMTLLYSSQDVCLGSDSLKIKLKMILKKIIF